MFEEFGKSGARENTPSKSEYFSWINNTNEGSTEQQTLTNFAYFEYLKRTYGMQLDIYAWDAGKEQNGACLEIGIQSIGKFVAKINHL